MDDVVSSLVKNVPTTLSLDIMTLVELKSVYAKAFLLLQNNPELTRQIHPGLIFCTKMLDALLKERGLEEKK